MFAPILVAERSNCLAMVVSFLLLEDLLKEYRYDMKVRNYSERTIKTCYNSSLKFFINLIPFKKIQCIRKNIKYFYLPRYEKQKIDRSYLSNLREQIESKDTHIKNLGGIIESKDIHINNLDEVIASKEECISNLSSEIDSNNQMISSLNEVIISKDADIKRLEEIAQERMDAIEEQRGYIEKLRRMIRNPFYAAYVVSKKVCKKLRGFVNTNNVENNAENDIDYFEKYKHFQSR